MKEEAEACCVRRGCGGNVLVARMSPKRPSEPQISDDSAAHYLLYYVSALAGRH